MNSIGMKNVDADENCNLEIDKKNLIALERENIAPSGTSTRCLIEVTMHGTKIDALVDTGAASSSISSKIIRKCGLTGLVDNRLKFETYGFGGSATSIGKIVGCKLMVGTTPIIWSFNVKGDAMIIGADFLEHYQAQLNFSEKNLIFKIAEETQEAPLKIVQRKFYHQTDMVSAKEKRELFIKQNDDVLAEDVKNRMKNVDHSAYLLRRYNFVRETISASLRGSNPIVLRVQLNGYPVEALIDTGNMLENAFPEAMVAKCGLESRIDSSKRMISFGVGGPVTATGVISNCVLKFGKHAYYVKLEVVPFTAHYIILSMEFLKKLNATINYKTQELEFLNEETRYRHPVHSLSVKQTRLAENLETVIGIAKTSWNTWADFVKKVIESVKKVIEIVKNNEHVK